MVAYLLVVLAALHAADCAYHGVRRAGAITLASLLLLQATLGVMTLLWHVLMLLALAHQCVAVVTLVAATVHAANLLCRHNPRHRAWRGQAAGNDGAPVGGVMVIVAAAE